MAYAPHNEAEAAYSDVDFQLDQATRKIAANDEMEASGRKRFQFSGGSCLIWGRSGYALK